MRDFLYPIQSSYVIQGIDGWWQATVKTEYLKQYNIFTISMQDFALHALGPRRWDQGASFPQCGEIPEATALRNTHVIEMNLHWILCF